VRAKFAAGALLLVAPQAGPATTFAYAADAIKPGRWEFTSQMQMPAMPQLPPGVTLPPGMSLPPGGGVKTTHTLCVEPDKAVPTDPRPECKIDRMQRDGGTINWATICTTAQGTVRSQGVAHYTGDKMEASLSTQVPQADGRTMDTSQHITGRYLGPCAK
jgi:uncharacterized protein DUF3617